MKPPVDCLYHSDYAKHLENIDSQSGSNQTYRNNNSQNSRNSTNSRRNQNSKYYSDNYSIDSSRRQTNNNNNNEDGTDGSNNSPKCVSQLVGAII